MNDVTRINYVLSANLLRGYAYFSGLILSAAYLRIRLINKLIELNVGKFDENQMKEILKSFHKLCDTIKLINECFWFIFVYKIFGFLFSCVLFFFNIYDIVIKGLSQVSAAFLFSGCFSLTMELLYISMIFTFSSLVEKGCVKFESNFVKYFSWKTNFSNFQFNNQKISISCGLFKIDWKLLFLIITSMFSYLIVIIQFVDALEANSVEKEVSN